MVTQTRIEDVRERVGDFTSALRQAGADDIARRIDGYASGFVDSTQVRRSVDAIRQQLRYFRAYPEELPELPVVQIAANRLEDACKEVLRSGMIEPARLTIRAQGKRKLLVVLGTLLVAVVVLLIPLAVAMAGVDVEDLWQGRFLPEVSVEQGMQVSVTVNALEATADPKATMGAIFSVAGDCPAELARSESCRAAGPRAFGSVELPAYEIMQPDQAYGIYLAFGESRLIGAVATGQAIIGASHETPLGAYVVPLSAAFVGYAPERCSWYLQLLSRCSPAQRGPAVRSDAVPVPTLRVRVIAAQQSPAQLLAEQNRVQHERAAQRATQLAGAVTEIHAVLDDTDKLLRGARFDAVTERVEKLTRLFEPLDALAVQATEADALPADVTKLRARFEAQRSQLAAFHDRAFEMLFKALTAARGEGPAKTAHAKLAADDDAVVARVAKQLGITRTHMDQIYTDHAEQLEQHLQRAAAAKEQGEHAAMATLLQRCGQLPKSAWQDVQAYLGQLGQRSGARSQLHECFTPRLSAKTCWSVVCDFDEITSAPGALVDTTKGRKWTFRLHGDHVIGHLDRVSEDGETLDP